MKTASATLTAFFNSGQKAICADLYSVLLQSGTVLRWTDADYDITLPDGRQFVRGPVIDRDRIRWVRGIQVDQMSVTVSGPTLLVDGLLLPTFATLGGFDGSTWALERFYATDNPFTQQGTLRWFSGVATNLDATDQGATLTIKSQMTQLNQQVPRNVYQAQCLNNLYDVNCTVNRDALRVDTSIASAQSGTSFVAPAGTPNGYFDLGIAKFTSGLNKGISRTVLTQVGTQFKFSRAFPFTISPGDTLSIWPGCDKSARTCLTKFNNVIHFRGQPYIPVPETIT